MFDFLKPKAKQSEPQLVTEKFFKRLKTGLLKTRQQFTQGLARLLLGKRVMDTELIEELEELLLSSDVGSSVTEGIITELSVRWGKQIDKKRPWDVLRSYLTSVLEPCEQPLSIPSGSGPYVILVVGVNGVGKTTSIGKLAYYLATNQGKRVMLAAGDTFRAAATEQLAVWAQRNRIALIAQHQGADSASVVYDALQAAQARNIEVLIVDTAGRLHTKDNLMEELRKIKKVLNKLDSTAPQEVLLILDATTGQNALSQAKTFHSALTLTGLMIAKLDGTAKGGIIFSIAKQLGVPIRFIGVGENIKDLRVFSAKEFVDCLLSIEEK